MRGGHRGAAHFIIFAAQPCRNDFVSGSIYINICAPITERGNPAKLVGSAYRYRLRVSCRIIDGSPFPVIARGGDNNNACVISIIDGAKQCLALGLHAEAHINHIDVIADAPFNPENNIGDEGASVMIERLDG
ncbi:hypothetical protein D3C78_1411960 [compost metagenome]